MGTSEVDTDQKDQYCNCCSGRDAILICFGSGIFQYPDYQQPESLYTMNSLIISKVIFIDRSFTDARIVYSKSYAHTKWEPMK